MNRQQRINSASATINFYRHYNKRLIPTKSKYYKSISKTSPNPIYKTRYFVTSEDVVNRIHETSELMKTGVLNFASATTPGGGYEKGAAAQEESLCRNSFLGFELKKFISEYYSYNRENSNSGLYPAHFIYSKDVLFVKNVIDGVERFVYNPKKVDVMTIAAPNKNLNVNNKHSEKDYTNDLANKILQTLRAFKVNECEAIVLGAFGCGVFGNDPKKVAKLFHLLLESDEFKGVFKEVHFSIFGKNENYSIFKDEFSK